MNPDDLSINLSEPLLLDPTRSHNKSQEPDQFFDCSDNPPLSDFHSFDQLSNPIFKSFMEDKVTINTPEFPLNPFLFSSNKNAKERNKPSLPSHYVSDDEIDPKHSKYRSMKNLEIYAKTVVLERYKDNFEDLTAKTTKTAKTLRKSFIEENSYNIVWIEPPRIDMTNRMINLLVQNSFFESFYMLLTFMNIAIRVYLMVYFYEIYMRGFEMGSFYLCFFYIPRICYMLSMMKILFHVDVEEVFVERISVGFNSFDDAPVKSWNQQLNYDYEINMNNFFGRKKNLFKKWKKKPMIAAFKSTLKAFFKRVLIILIPVETTIIFYKLFYTENSENKGTCVKLFLISNWIYQCYECLMLIPCVFCLYFIEYKFNEFWTPGDNKDSLAFVIQIWETVQFLLINTVLFAFNCRKLAVGPFEFHKCLMK